MAGPAKPAAKPAAGAATDAATGEPPKKSRKTLIIAIIAVVVLLLIGGGVAAYLLVVKPAHTEDAADAGKGGKNAEEETREKTPAKFVELGTFTANLVREEGDQYLQAGISLKLSKPDLEDRIKANSPEILHRVNMVLQSKRPSEINTYEGKMKLAGQIKEQVEYVLGMRKVAPAIGDEPAQSAPAERAEPVRSGIAEVLFTSFIIQ